MVKSTGVLPRFRGGCPGANLGPRGDIDANQHHGAAYGRILTGIQVPPEDNSEFQQFLDELGYESWEETDNPAYKIFLS